MENAEPGAEILQQILRCLLYEQAISDKEEELSDQAHATGICVVGGGSDYDVSWEVRDNKTGGVIASGVGSESYEEASADARISWIRIDGISKSSLELVEESYWTAARAVFYQRASETPCSNG